MTNKYSESDPLSGNDQMGSFISFIDWYKHFLQYLQFVYVCTVSTGVWNECSN